MYAGILLLHVGNLQVRQAGTSRVKEQLSYRDTGLQVLDEELKIPPSPILIMPIFETSSLMKTNTTVFQIH